MAVWTVVAAIVYTLMNTTVVRYQRFALRIARAASAELGGDSPRQVRALQRALTPALLNSLAFLGYVVLAVAFVMAYRTWGWMGAGPLLAWGYLATAVLQRVWPLPDRETCVRIASGELRREGQLRNLEDDERALVRKVMAEQLEAVAAT